MSLDKENHHLGDVPDPALAAAERDSAGQALRNAAAHIAPDPEFAVHLEARLLRGSQSRERLYVRPRYKLQPQNSPQAASGAARFFGQRRVQFAMSGLAVSLAVLLVFGLSVLFGQENGANLASSGGSNAVIPTQPTMAATIQAPPPVTTAINQAPPPVPTAPTTPVGTVQQDEPAPRMPLTDFKKLYDDPAKRPLIIDVRAKEAFDAGHIEGAISFPEADVDIRVGELPKDKLVIAYCQ